MLLSSSVDIGSLALTCQLFAPTTLRVTFETEGTGAFSEKEAEQLVRRDAYGNVVELVLPKKLVIIANHQVRLLLKTF